MSISGSSEQNCLSPCANDFQGGGLRWVDMQREKLGGGEGKESKRIRGEQESNEDEVEQRRGGESGGRRMQRRGEERKAKKKEGQRKRGG